VEFKVQMPKYLSVNQRTIVEMLADEMGDQNAKRVMNLNQFRDSPPPSGSSPSGPGASKTDEHKNEGFLKNMWHSMTGQHDQLDNQQQQQEKGKNSNNTQDDEEEPRKKASGSGGA
jgi:molecular chaperone DnaJ